jgi:hypothetical protein
MPVFNDGPNPSVTLLGAIPTGPAPIFWSRTMSQQVAFSLELAKVLAISAGPLKVLEKWGFRENQRVVVQAVAALPIQTFSGTILYVWEDGTATVKFDYQIPFDTERELVKCGRVDLHYLNRISS